MIMAELYDSLSVLAKLLRYMLLRVSAKFCNKQKQKHSVALVRKRTIPTERLPFVGEVSANF
jgi:hypothetical protein